MEPDERDRIFAEADKQIARAKRLIEEGDQALRQQGIDPEEARARARALFADPEMKRCLEEAKAQVRREAEQAKAHESFYNAAPGRRKAPRSTV